MPARIAALIAVALSHPAAAEDPLSAIDWLSNSVTQPSEAPVPAPLPEPASDIEVSALDAPKADAAGLLSPETTGLPLDLWGPATVQDVTARINAVPRQLSPALTRLLIKVLLAEATPPAGDTDETLLLSRVDRLLEIGALDRAAALLERAGPHTPGTFRRSFDIALLRGEEQIACNRLRARPEVSPTYPARIFCLARNGDWNAAAVTLETANSLGILSEDEDLMLARFLDPEIEDDGTITFDRATPTPLMFRMFEAVGEPLPTNAMPLAFAWADLRETRGWKARLDAAERLARAGVLSPNQLIGLYLERQPSASGMVWDRVEAVHDLESALATTDDAALAEALTRAWSRMREADLHHVLAAQYGAGLDARGLPGDAGRIARVMGLLSPAFASVAAGATADEPRDRFILALARGVPETAIAPDAQSLAVRHGFTDALPPEDGLTQLVDDGRVGETVLKAISQLADGAAGDPDGISTAIAALRAVGQEDAARRASLELLLRNDTP